MPRKPPKDVKPGKAIDNELLAAEIRSALASVELVLQRTDEHSVPPTLTTSLHVAENALMDAAHLLDELYDY